MNRVFPFLHLDELPYRKIIFRLGYPSEEKVPVKDKKILSTLIQKTTSLWKPKGVIRNSAVVKMSNDSIICENITVPGASIVAKFKGAFRLSFLAVTAGLEVSEWMEDLKQAGELASATMVDAILSEATDALVIQLNRLIEREAALKSYSLTMRFSPGYGDVPLSFQKELLKFLEGEKIGISLTESYLMLPEKSVTAVIGWIAK